MKRNVFATTAVMLALLPLLYGCKPTEANYRSAYEAANKGRDTAAADDGLPANLIREGEPRWKTVGTDSVMFLCQPLMRLDGDTLPLKPYNVAIAQYGMKANAEAHSGRLLAAGYNSRVLKTREGKYLTIAAQEETIEATVPFIRRYMEKNTNDMYSGLPGRPVVEMPTAPQL